jgi:hypothetical protein
MARPVQAVTAAQNITRALSTLGLMPGVEIIEAREDRVIAQCTPIFQTYVRSYFTRDPGKPTLHPGAVESWREPGAVMPALQVCFLEGDRAEIDLDLAAPLGGDVASLVVHAAEVLWHWATRSKTDQVRIARMLDKRFKNA